MLPVGLKNCVSMLASFEYPFPSSVAFHHALPSILRRILNFFLAMGGVIVTYSRIVILV